MTLYIADSIRTAIFGESGENGNKSERPVHHGSNQAQTKEAASAARLPGEGS